MQCRPSWRAEFLPPVWGASVSRAGTGQREKRSQAIRPRPAAIKPRWRGRIASQAGETRRSIASHASGSRVRAAPPGPRQARRSVMPVLQVHARSSERILRPVWRAGRGSGAPRIGQAQTQGHCSGHASVNSAFTKGQTGKFTSAHDGIQAAAVCAGQSASRSSRTARSTDGATSTSGTRGTFSLSSRRID